MQPLRIRYLIVAILALVLPGWSSSFAAAPLGDEMLLFQEIPSVFSASKYEQKVTEAPSSVSIVTAEEIKKYGYRTLADILRSLRSFYVTYNRRYHQAGVRGFNRPGDSNSRFLLLIDGLRTNDSVFSAAAIDTSFTVDVDLIDRVEVIRGPSSSLYGTNAFFGVINVITRRGRDLQGVEISGEAGTQDTYDGRISYGNRFQTGLEMLLSGTWYESEGNDRIYFKEFDTPATNNGVARNGDENEAYSLFGKFSFGDFTLEGAYVDWKKRVPTAPYGTLFNEPRNEGGSEQGLGQLTYERHLADRWDVLARVGYNHFASYGDYVYNYPPVVTNKDEFRGDWWNAELQLGRQLSEKHRLIFGGEYQDHFRQDQKNFDKEVFFLYLDEERASENWGVFALDEFKVLDKLTFNLGVRHDQYDTFGGTTNPRLAMIWTPFEKTTIKLLYGEAFRAPNAYELDYHDGLATQKPNPDLGPEEIETWEVVWEQYLGNRMRAVVECFYYEIDDLINLALDQSDGLVFFENLDEVEAKGVEVELEGKWDSLSGRISYTFQQTQDGSTDQHLSNSPKHLARFNLTVPLLRDKVLLGVEEQYTSKRKTRSREETGGYAVTNLTLFGQELVKGLEVSASVYNLFNKKFSDPVSAAQVQDTIEQDGRVFRFKLTYIF